MQSATKTRKENNITDHIGVYYVKADTKLSWLIGSGAEQHITDRIDAIHIENEA